MEALKIPSPPRTIMEVFKMLPEGTLVEVIDGVLIMSPMPTAYHQRVLGRILVSIQDHLKSCPIGELFLGPLDVYLDDHSNAVQPDLSFVLETNSDIVKDFGMVGAPDLIMGISKNSVYPSLLEY